MNDEIKLKKLRSYKYGDHAKGLHFYCPACDDIHGVIIEGDTSKVPVWKFNGDYDRPTFEPSIRVTYNKSMCHFHIENGNIKYCGDCTHDFKNKIIELPLLPDYMQD